MARFTESGAFTGARANPPPGQPLDHPLLLVGYQTAGGVNRASFELYALDLPEGQGLLEFLAKKPIGPEAASTVPRTFVTHEWPIKSELIAPGRNRNGSGLVRTLAASARKKGAEILLQHKMTGIVRENA